MNDDPARSIEFSSTAIDRFRSAAPELRNLGSERMVRCQQIKGYIALGDFDVAASELTEIASATPVEHRVRPLIQRVDEIAQLARGTSEHARGVATLCEVASEFRRGADLGPLRALAADSNGAD
ncbi:hypothetical protein ACFYO1_02940 [Nocardia sp. NPDC006044]|uniref:hypothetical protein n=1 Tax=Nocardia sp. NPDC006044 TaxID=3364306 RepID=UPI0036B989F6